MSCFSDIPLIKGKKFLVLSILALTIILNSCLDETVSSYSEETKITQWAPNIKYAVAYNEEKTVLQTTWPGGKVAGFSKASSDGSEGLLIDYSNQRVVTEIDDEGYISITSKHLNGGDAWMNMPPEIYNRLKDKRPAKPNDYDPVVLSEMKNGQVISITNKGIVVPVFTYDPEKYRVDPLQLDSTLDNSLKKVNNTTKINIENRYSELLLKYKHVEMLNNFLAAVERPFTNCCSSAAEESEIAVVKSVIDLRDGTIIRKGFVDQQGRISDMHFIHYKKVNGFMIENYRKTYEMAEHNGRYFPKYISYNRRSDIEIYTN